MVELRKRGVISWIIVSETFRPLVVAQARARKLEPHMLVVRHPVGGLNAEELVERIDTAFDGLMAELRNV